jgi:hypothetical protein
LPEIEGLNPALELPQDIVILCVDGNEFVMAHCDHERPRSIKQAGIPEEIKREIEKAFHLSQVRISENMAWRGMKGSALPQRLAVSIKERHILTGLKNAPARDQEQPRLLDIRKTLSQDTGDGCLLSCVDRQLILNAKNIIFPQIL